MEPSGEMGGGGASRGIHKPESVGKILVIRGGAIGDFILTLPSVALLREGFPDWEIEIMGYSRTIPLGLGRSLADRGRCIEYGLLAACFNPAAEMGRDLVEYFCSFDQIVSYLYDPDELFRMSLRKVGVKSLIQAVCKVEDKGNHAVEQLAEPLRVLGLRLTDAVPRLCFSEEERVFGSELNGRVVIHPGSGSPRKNWPLENWVVIIRELARLGVDVVVVGGEADEEVIQRLREGFGAREGIQWLLNLPLRDLAMRLAGCRLFVGHDSGISHLAAASGCAVLAIFGPTDPGIWRPLGRRVRVVGGLMEDWSGLSVDVVLRALEEML